LYNFVHKVDGDQTKPPAHNKQHNIPAVFEGGSVDEYATQVYANSAKTAYIDPRDYIDLLPRAFNDILPQVYAFNAWLPYTYCSICEGNDTLVLHYDDGGAIRSDDVTIKLPHGNRSVDDIVAFLSDVQLDEYVARYDKNTTRLTLEGMDNAEVILVVMLGTTCQRLLGLDVG
jgi:hypothetical protein